MLRPANSSRHEAPPVSTIRNILRMLKRRSNHAAAWESSPSPFEREVAHYRGLAQQGGHGFADASELLAVFAQRLARRICLACREPADLEPAIASEIFPQGPPANFLCYRGRGCDHCAGSSSYGRIAVGAALEDLRDVARRARLNSLRERALELVQDGTISFESLPRFIPLDRLVP